MSPFFAVWLAGYLAVVNATAFLCFGWDKHQARRHRRRIAERTLLLLAAVGGSLGAITGIYLFRHKTLHRRFTIGIPCLMLLQLMLAGLSLWFWAH